MSPRADDDTSSLHGAAQRRRDIWRMLAVSVAVSLVIVVVLYFVGALRASTD